MARLAFLPSHRRGTVGVLILLGLIISAGVWRLAEQREAERIHAEFMRRAQAQASLARERLRLYEEMVYGLREVFLGQTEVTRSEFARVTREMLQRHSGVQALEWVQIVPDFARAQVEARASQELGRPFVIRRRQSSGQLAPAEKDREYYVILYIEPVAGNEPALGYDVTSAPTAGLIASALHENRLKVSHAFRLSQSANETDEPGVIFILPTPNPSDGLMVQGFAQGVFRIQTMLSQAHQTPDPALDCYYLDIDSTEAAPMLLYANLAGREPLREKQPVSAPLRSDTEIFQDIIQIGDRRWAFIAQINPAWSAGQRTAQPWLALGASFAITTLLALFAHSILQRTERIERQVTQRTAELLETEARLQVILDHSPAIIFVKDLEGRYLLFNEQFDRMCAPNMRPLRGRTDFELFPHAEAEIYRAHDREVIACGKPMRFEEAATHANGTKIISIVQKFPLLDGEGRPYALCGIATDITERLTAEQQRLQLERQLLEAKRLESLGVLAGGIAHDFNNLLTAVLGNASLARAQLSRENGAQPQLLQIENAARRAADLCSQMLAYAGKGNFITTPLNLSSLVRDTTALLEVSVPKGTRLVFRLAGQLPAVQADATQLRQIIMNLVLNAADAIGGSSTGEVVLTTQETDAGPGYFRSAVRAPDLPSGRYVALEVRDNGSGMSPETLARIFEPFFTTKFSGRGLGLAAVLGIMQSHHGALFVQSQQGKGTTFRLFFPALATAAPEEEKTTAPLSTPPTQFRGTILVVDDEESVRVVAGEVLQRLGLKVLVAVNGTAALQVCRERGTDIDLVLLDLTMPGLSGEETLRRMRLLNLNQKVVVMSGYSETETMQRCTQLGAAGFLHKPFEIATITQKIRSQLG